MTVHDLVSRKHAERMLRRYAAPIAALAIDTEDAALRHADWVYADLEAPLRWHSAGFTAAVNWNTALRLWATAGHAPGVRLLREEPWVELDIHGLLRVHLTRDGISEPSSDRQQARISQAQDSLFPPACTRITNVEAISHRSATGQVIGMSLCAPKGTEVLWTIAVDMDHARKLLHRWQAQGVPWLQHNNKLRAPVATKLEAAVTKPSAPTAPFQQSTPTRNFRPKPQTGSHQSGGS